jgi:hypothetical protein
VAQPPECATPARSDHQEIIIPAGDLDKHGPGLAAHHHWFNIHARWHSPEHGVEGAVQPLPCGIAPYLPQPGVWAAALGEIAARRNPGMHGHQNPVVCSCFSRSMAQCLQAAH